MEDFGSRCTNIEVLVWILSVPLRETENIDTPPHIPRNSTQFISMSFLSPSADNGRSLSRLRSTKGPTSGRFVLFTVGSFGFFGSILKQFALKLPSSHISNHMPTHRALCRTRFRWSEFWRAGYHFGGTRQGWSKQSKHQSNLTPLNSFTLCLLNHKFTVVFKIISIGIYNTTAKIDFMILVVKAGIYMYVLRVAI
jgi:hypothetical protein